MCGRMTMTPGDLSAITRILGVEADPELAKGYRPRFNLPPTDQHMMVVSDGKKRLVPARWGFGRDPAKPQINARAETVARNGLFKRAFQERRCLVPVDGFYEWLGAAGRRRPIWFHAPPGQLLLLAGIFDARGFAVITTAANGAVAPVHDRMPAILVGDAADRWLAAPEPSLLAPAPEGLLLATPVSSRVNSVANDDADCLAAAEEPPQLRLL
jgi:putative SOS response-associated peptidase YedK